MIRTAAVLTMVLAIASGAHAQERAPGTMRVVTLATPAGAEPRTSRAEMLVERMTGLGADLLIQASRRGSVILSRHPLLDLRDVELSPAAEGEERCVATIARVAQPGLPGGVYVVGAHLGARDGAVNPADVRQLSALVAELPGPVVLASDLDPLTRQMVEPLAPTPGSPLADRAGARADHLLATPELPAASASVQSDPRDSGRVAVVADLMLHPPVPVLPVRRASLDRDVVEN